VDLERVEVDRALASVHGTERYEVEVLVRRGGDEVVTLWCDCPAFVQWGPCKHLWAVLLAAGAVPAGDDRESAGATERAASPSRGAGAAWRLRLDALSRCAALQPAGHLELASRAERIAYRIEADSSAPMQRLFLEALVQRRRADGSFGAPRSARAGQLRARSDATDPADRHILALLGGASSWLTAPFSTVTQWHLEGELGRLVLPLLLDTGRLFLRGGAEPLARDGGEPWRARISVDRDGEEVVLAAHLSRDDERMDLLEPALLVEWGWLVAGGRAMPFDARGAGALLDELRHRGPLSVPREAALDLVATVAAMDPAGVTELRGVEVRDGVAPRVRLLVEGSGAAGGRRDPRLPCALRFDYGGGPVEAGDPRPLVEGPSGELVRRSAAAEGAALARFVAAGGERSEADVLEGRDGALRASRLPALARALLAEDWEVRAEAGLLRLPGTESVSVRSGIDWFEVRGGVEFGDSLAPFPALLAAAREGSRTVALGDGSAGLLPEGWLARWRLLGELGEADGDALRVPEGRAWLLDALLAEREGVRTDGAFEAVRARLARAGRVRPVAAPRGLRAELRPYQREGLGWLRFLQRTGLGGCLADDMGLGKTVQVLALLVGRRSNRPRPDHPSLVVAPRSLAFHWRDEAARFAPGLRVHDHTGQDRWMRAGDLERADVVVTTYGTLRRDAPRLAERRFDWVVLDEAQAIKNPRSQVAKAARLLDAERRVALSGTPIENHLGELWSLFDFLNPGMLGGSSTFRRLTSADGAEDRALLARALRPFILRRTKDEVLTDLPPKTEQTLLVDLSPRERRHYDELRDRYRAEVLGKIEDVGVERASFLALEALLRLRQAACHPGLLDAARRDQPSAKLEELLQRLAEVVDEGHKALVFSQFTSLLAIVRDRLDGRGQAYAYLDGRTRRRAETVRRFQEDSGCPLFLISLKAGGHGLNLTAADYVFLLDPWWNPAVEAQAVDRTHRIGQRRPVFAYRLIARDTVEEKVLELQECKRELADAVLGGGRGGLRGITREELEALLA
jgi:superfamily II DNA or RNA helicase